MSARPPLKNQRAVSVGDSAMIKVTEQCSRPMPNSNQALARSKRFMTIPRRNHCREQISTERSEGGDFSFFGVNGTSKRVEAGTVVECPRDERTGREAIAGGGGGGQALGAEGRRAA